MRLLGLSGSLRQASLNTAALDAAVRLVPAGVTLDVYRGLRDVPLYDHDRDSDDPPPAVRALRACVATADALIIASPEYAHGISGPMKNALDWLVGDVDFPGKPIAVWNTSPRAIHAHAHLREVLATMSAHLIEDAAITLPLLGRDWTAASIAASAELATGIAQSLRALRHAIKDDRAP